MLIGDATALLSLQPSYVEHLTLTIVKDSMRGCHAALSRDGETDSDISAWVLGIMTKRADVGRVVGEYEPILASLHILAVSDVAIFHFAGSTKSHINQGFSGHSFGDFWQDEPHKPRYPPNVLFPGRIVHPADKSRWEHTVDGVRDIANRESVTYFQYFAVRFSVLLK